MSEDLVQQIQINEVTRLGDRKRSFMVRWPTGREERLTERGMAIARLVLPPVPMFVVPSLPEGCTAVQDRWGQTWVQVSVDSWRRAVGGHRRRLSSLERDGGPLTPLMPVGEQAPESTVNGVAYFTEREYTALMNEMPTDPGVAYRHLLEWVHAKLEGREPEHEYIHPE